MLPHYATIKRLSDKSVTLFWTDSVSPFAFYNRWEMIIEYDLDSNNWLTDVYEMRFDWIPIYYKDEALPGSMRTTSIS